MLSRVLKEVKLPFPDDFFPEMAVSPQLAADFHYTATRLLRQTLEDETPVTRFHPSQQPDQWKLIGDRNGLQLYRERGFVKGNAVKLNALGQVTGTLEDLLLGLYAATNGALKTQRAIMHSDYLDAAVLHVLKEDPYSEDDTGFSFQFSGLKWLASAPTGKLVHKRDLCWYEELGRTQDANGDEVAYLVLQSVRVDECPPFEQQGLTRSTAAVCYVFRPLPNNLVGVYMKGQHAVGGKSRSWSADSIMAELWLGVASALDCAKAKRLSKLVSGKEMFITSSQSKSCDICDSKLKMLKSNQNCKICGKNVCDRCRMTKMIYPSRNTGNFPCSYFFCKPCLSDAKEKLYGRSAMRVSFHSEDSSGRSGSNRSGSPRYVRAPSTGRPGLSMTSSASDPTAGLRQRAPSRDQVGPAMPPYRAHGPRPSSPRSSNCSYSSARATVSSDPSMSYSSSTLNTGFSRNDSLNSASVRAYQPPTSRSLENRSNAAPPRVQRTTSDQFRRNPASRAYSNSRMPVQNALITRSQSNGSRFMGNQSIDSTYDVEGGETYRGHGYLSDESDLSEESSSEDEQQSHSNRRRKLINVYDADEGSVIEINRPSDSGSDSSEPEPVDVFEKDKLKYINSFRTNEIGSSVGGATASSNGSTEQENLMERLMQINMAAEATYLMAKYNSNIQANK